MSSRVRVVRLQEDHTAAQGLQEDPAALGFEDFMAKVGGMLQVSLPPRETKDGDANSKARAPS